MAAHEAALPIEPAATAPAVRARPGTVSRLRADRKGRAGLLTLLLAILLFAGPLVLGVDPLFQDLRARLAPPSASHPLGTDQLGRDLLARLLVGGQTSLAIGFVASILAAIIGVATGMIAGYAGRFWDGLITSVADVQLTFPNILLALSVMVVLGPGIGNLILVLVLSSWVFQARNWGTPEMDAMILKARATLDPASREAQYQEIGKTLLDEAVAVPLYDQVDSYGVSKRLKGFQARADELMYLYGASVEG
jgi:ABC-type Fe3+ transport system permease subunit